MREQLYAQVMGRLSDAFDASRALASLVRFALKPCGVIAALSSSNSKYCDALTLIALQFMFCADELIRQATIERPERGLVLLRVRDEIRMTIAAYRTLYQVT